MIGENNFIGKQIDTFRLITELSSGQVSSTYKAEQMQSSPRVVVCKLFHAVHLPEIQRERFLQEIRLLKKVRHPHILPVLEGGFYEGSPYIVSEYATYGSVRDRLNSLTTPLLPMQEAVAIIAEIGRALQFFHQINITHGNLKPENILFNERREMLVADNSITAIEDSVPIERTHNMNTFPYMAPEQFHGRANKESDQYALGCIAYELLTGIAPFAGTAFQSMAVMHSNDALVPPSQLNMLLPAYLQGAILTAMAKQETSRFPHIKDFIAALTPGMKTQNVPVLQPSSTIASHLHTQDESAILAPPQENSAVITLQDDKPPDTPTIKEEIEPIWPVPQQRVPILPLPAFGEATDFPPNTPAQPVEDAATDEHLSQNETREAAAGDSFFEEDIVTQPDLKVVSVQHNAVASANHVMSEVEQAHMVYAAEIPVEAVQAVQAVPYAFSRGNNSGNRITLAKNLMLLVGISWAIIAILILSMIFIIIPSAHILTNIVSPIGQKATPHPTLQPTPTAHPTTVPTARPTPVPSPSPIPTPSPTATPVPTPSPSPIVIPVLTVSPTSLHGHTDCQSVPFGFKCTVTLSLPQSYPGNAHWTATSSGNITAIFVPSHGTLSPGQQQTVNIFIGKTCPNNGSLIFATQDAKAIVSWNC